MGLGLECLPPAWGYPLGECEGVGGVGGGLDGMDVGEWPCRPPPSGVLGYPPREGAAVSAATVGGTGVSPVQASGRVGRRLRGATPSGSARG